MTGMYKRIGDRIRKTAFVFPIFFIFLLLLIGSSYLMVEDYFTSLWGFKAIRMNPGFKPTPYVIAALPQLVQIAAYYVNLALRSSDPQEDEEYASYRRFAALICAAMVAIDFATDYRHRIMTATNPMDYILMAVVTFGVFTIGSEVIFTISFGTVAELWPDAKRRWYELRELGKKISREHEQTKPRPGFGGSDGR